MQPPNTLRPDTEYWEMALNATKADFPFDTWRANLSGGRGPVVLGAWVVLLKENGWTPEKITLGIAVVLFFWVQKEHSFSN